MKQGQKYRNLKRPVQSFILLKLKTSRKEFMCVFILIEIKWKSLKRKVTPMSKNSSRLEKIWLTKMNKKKNNQLLTRNN